MRVRVESDGTFHGTRIVNSETGEPVEGVIALKFAVKAGEPTPVAELTVGRLWAGIEADATYSTPVEPEEAQDAIVLIDQRESKLGGPLDTNSPLSRLRRKLKTLLAAHEANREAA